MISVLKKGAKMAASIFPMVCPKIDPAPIFELFRGNYATELLTASVVHFNLFEEIGLNQVSSESLRAKLGLERRAWVVLITGLKASGLLLEKSGNLTLSEIAKSTLLKDSRHSIASYIGLSGQSSGVLEMVNRLRVSKPVHADKPDVGAAFIFREGLDSAMDKTESAMNLTLSLSGRAMNVAPVLAEKLPLPDNKILLDVGTGSGLYSIALLEKNKDLKAILWDGAEVLKVADNFVNQAGLASRVTSLPGDMFADSVPAGVDVVLLSNILHDWDEPECIRLINKLVNALPKGGLLLIHDVFLNDELDGPLEIALYSAALFSLTEGRAYSKKEYQAWLNKAGMTLVKVIPTLAHCGVMVFSK